MIKVDVSGFSALAVCLCGWRGLADDRLGALRQARHHELRAHSGSRAALDALRQYETRQTARHQK